VKTDLFGAERWKPALDKFTEVTGLSVELFDAGGQRILNPPRRAPLDALFREYGFEPGLFADCASRCLSQAVARPAVFVAESHGLMVVGTALLLEREIVGAAVAGYALAWFSQVPSVQRWAKQAGVPFDRLWSIMRQQAPLPERRLKLLGELLQVLGDALLREGYRTWQSKELVVKLEAAAAAKDEFLAVVSHELLSPLTPITGWASVLKKAQSLEQVHRAAEAIEHNALLAGRMVEDLLDMNRVARDRMELDLRTLQLPALVRSVLDSSAQDIEKKTLGLQIIDAGEPLPVEGDAGRLEQVFRNILSNAVKFTPAGGSIRVTLGREADSARVVIADTGRGIAPDFLPFVFDMFRQQAQGTHRGREGLGIGLSLVKKLVELHKGTVSISSAGPQRGTEVSVRLPLAARLPQPVNAAAAAEPALPFAGLSVLVVEDLEDSRESLRALLQGLGATVCVARDGREGLEMMLQGARPDVVLCDLLMPRMDGFDFIRGLERAPMLAHPPVIAMSSLVGSRERSRKAGFEGHLGKPYDEAAIIAAVGAATRRR
jgi:signal transduction histidine kinase